MLCGTQIEQMASESSIVAENCMEGIPENQHMGLKFSQ